jgi:hypothetical protein
MNSWYKLAQQLFPSGELLTSEVVSQIGTIFSRNCFFNNAYYTLFKCNLKAV